MKILLDECVTKKLSKVLQKGEIYTVIEMGWSGIKNGKLFSVAAKEGFDLLLTIDKNMEYQQNTSEHPIIIVVFDVMRNKVDEYLPLVDPFYQQLSTMEKGRVYKITAEA